jgi:hypothetical protein
MDCLRASNLLSVRLDGEIGPDDGTILDAHLAQCAACRTAADEIERQDAELRRVFVPRRAAAADVATRVVCALSPPALAGRRRVWSIPLAMAAGFLLALVALRPWQAPPVAVQPAIVAQNAAPPKSPGNSEFTHRVNDLLTCGTRFETAATYEDEIRACGGDCAKTLARHIQTCRSAERAERVWAARILSDVAERSCIPDLIALVGDEDGDVCRYAADALTRLTGRPHCADVGEPGADAPSPCASCQQTWHSWWQANREQYERKS